MIEKSDYSEENYTDDFEIWRGNIQFEDQNIARSQPPLESTPVGEKRQTQKYQQQTQLL